jgi:hypothetical protein
MAGNEIVEELDLTSRLRTHCARLHNRKSLELRDSMGIDCEQCQDLKIRPLRKQGKKKRINTEPRVVRRTIGAETASRTSVPWRTIR